MGAVEASQLSTLSWQAPWEVLFLVVALALAQVSLLLHSHNTFTQNNELK